ncbi:MAG: LLM class flavin-dependent oxidoreductase [Gammaproteobacteria bacterium]|nr:LLM class flavin-dependent oxidoreductase [Gammaproteobacteria bacterium]
MDIDIILNEFTSPQEAAELGLLAERYGVRGVWASNYGWSRDPFLTLAPLAQQSTQIRLGPLAVSPYELHPLKMANLLLGLNEMSRGRAMITVGGGGAVLQAIGMKRERMVRAVRECLEILTADVTNKSLNYEGELYKVYGYKAEWATDKRPLIYVGSNHPQTRRLSANLADGLMTSDFCVPLMKDFIESTHADLKEAGRSPADFRFNNFWAWHIKDDAAASMREARRELILRGYLGEKYFQPFLSDDEIRLMTDNFQAFLDAFMNSTDVIEGVPEELVNKMIDNISFAGGLDAIDKAIATLNEFADIGLTEIALRVHDDPADAIKLIGEQVMPRLG